jgi:predicted enzyme related to lactoylglutathione lyase
MFKKEQLMADNFKEGEFCWNELLTPDVEKSKKFYSELFGWQITDHDMGHTTYSMFGNGEKNIGGMMAIPKDKAGDIPPHWMSYIFVNDLDVTVANAKSLGAQIKQPPMDVGDFGRLAVIQDPTGAHIAFWQALQK